MLKRLFEMVRGKTTLPTPRTTRCVLEGLEDRRLLSAGFMPFHGGMGGGMRGPGWFVEPIGTLGRFGGSTIQFSQTPQKVQDGLNALATAGSLTAPTSTQMVYLGNANGIETYAITLSGTGTISRLTVDQNGKAVIPPTHSNTTFSAVGNAAVTDEITNIATALNLTAPTDSTPVSVTTASDGTSTYAVRLSSATPTWHAWRGTVITVDASGNPVGDQRLPLSVMPDPIKTGLTTNAPAGATALTDTSLVNVRTANGVTFYSATYNSAGTTSVVTVNSAGTPTSLPSVTQVDFSTVPQAAQTELQTLATAAGVADPISTTQPVLAFAEGNGTTVYSATLRATVTARNGATYTRPVTVSSDQNGNATVPPTGNCFSALPILSRAGTNTTTTTSTTPSTATAASNATSTPRKLSAAQRRHRLALRRLALRRRL